jgi:hypothetical protein
MVRRESRKRRWLNGLGMAFLAVLWLFIAGLAFDKSVIAGIAVFVAGVIYVAAEIWIARNGERHERFVIAWQLGWRLGLGVVVGALGVGRSHSTLGVVVGVALGCLVALPPLAIAATFWLVARRNNRRPSPPAS